MNRFRRGRNVSQWAGLQTGPMTVDVDAVWANRDRNPVPPHPVPPTLNDPVKYISPLTAYAEYERTKTNAHTPAAAVAQAAVAERASTPPAEASPDAAAAETTPLERETYPQHQGTAQLPQRQGTASAVPSAAEHSGVSALVAVATPEAAAHSPSDKANLLDSLPAFKAAMESFEKRGDPIMVSVDAEPSDAEAEYERSAASIHTEAAVTAERAKRRENAPTESPTQSQRSNKSPSAPPLRAHNLNPNPKLKSTSLATSDAAPSATTPTATPSKKPSSSGATPGSSNMNSK